ncbi:hypothetical protein AYO21_04729 [Fonsecaea monophora]|uniref:Uncharacterized protein n=1 Tax=Fonsecaea monophora TaxID=254056 RepID=A0A177FBB2_9EURO|nr:hypothetical protein AYO21_04729 [Fonsecaea monophora]KAH0839136.1 hypothetical protein FOPE_05472 [Fonsecaea pedrosoi]OAG41116.1 hypothetical protein AYO21_04729 [Fonsecaea monophora]
MDPKPAEPPIHRPKQLTDLPNEILAHICEYLLFDHGSRPTLFQAGEDKRTLIPAKVEAMWKFKGVEGLEGDTERFADSVRRNPNQYFTNFRPEFAWAAPSVPKERRSTGLAGLAASCRRFHSHVQRLPEKHVFTMTVNFHGLTFENLRNASPTQTFRNGSLNGGRPVMASLEGPMLVYIPKMQLPGNTAFGAFTTAFKNMRHLNIHVELYGPGEKKKLELYLEQIGQFLIFQAGSHRSLSTLDIIVHVDYRIPASSSTGSRDASAFRDSMNTKIPWRFRLPSSAADWVYETCGGIRDFVRAMHKVQTVHNTSPESTGPGREGTRAPFKLRLFLRGHHKDHMVGVDETRYPIEMPLESFETLCGCLQDWLFSGYPTAENRIIDRQGCIAELGFSFEVAPPYDRLKF